MDPKEDKWIFCDCYHHALVVHKDEDWDFLDISFWEYGHRTGRSFKAWFGAFWNFLKNGHDYYDCILVQKDNVDELIEMLQEARSKLK